MISRHLWEPVVPGHRVALQVFHGGGRGGVHQAGPGGQHQLQEGGSVASVVEHHDGSSRMGYIDANVKLGFLLMVHGTPYIWHTYGSYGIWIYIYIWYEWEYSEYMVIIL